MGRPLEKRQFGNTSGSGQQIQVTAFIPVANSGSSAVTGYINRQKNDTRFNVTTAQGTGVCSLSTGSVTAGLMKINGVDSAGNTYVVSKISGRTATVYQVAGGSNYVFDNGEKAPWLIGGTTLPSGGGCIDLGSA
jgi:hypothetical protein